MGNVLANECYSTFFYLTRSDLRHQVDDFEGAIEILNRSYKPSVVTPVLTNRIGENIPSIQIQIVRVNYIYPISFFPKRSYQRRFTHFWELGS